nr:reverse transcriptase domain-containing protein [Tanacetum cinerariifolium]
ATTTRSGVTLAGPLVSPPPSKEVDREPETITDQVLTGSTNNVPSLVVQPSPAFSSSTPISFPKIPEVKSSKRKIFDIKGTFQRGMMAIFHDMIEKTIEVFMDDFSVFSYSFLSFLSHLDQMLQRYEDTNLVLNWKKYHFMVKEGIIPGHKISKSRIEVDSAKVDVIAKLPHPTSVKGVRSF